ncbi:glutathione S-transferase family protein [Myxosarcina sp. GI1]|uniref:glutathione S-transferase family protein n=1 Tax=Myxosarcina sp. GI1 TaxID=1541065 RepID=UPI000560D025|nr:glutathione S-transferase family protein [Myxosarcina sp. GI1]
MLQFYYHPLSPLARRVWIALLEKEIPFEPVVVNLKDGEQFKPEFLQLNPFHHVPVIVDNNFRVLESLAILDYLEHKYPEPALLPKNTQRLAIVRMVEMVTTNELGSQVIPLIVEKPDSPKLKRAKRKLERVLNLFAELLADEPYFGGNRLSLGDIVAANGVILISKLGYELDTTPRIKAWCDRLMQRQVWQKTQPNAEQIEIFKQTVTNLVRNT